MDGELALPEFTEAYWDDELETKVREIYPTLYDIIVGQSDEAERLKAFIQGGKARRTLAQRVGSGNFNRTQFTQISMMLQSEFLPDLNTTKNLPLPSRAKSSKGKKSRDVGQPMKQPGDITKDFSNQKRLHFVTDVLLPETVIRLTMKAHSITHSEADSRILEGVRDQRTDTWWVDDILAARDSFLDGQAHSS
ncbi:hypothetical protein BGW38_000905 [Lunasporangiospora selenospora]|uniref:Uncharacterized protein n=1 Tax=Lunasporangiospora selenospora TaxID=979761 RepID=A0A9P6KEM5_9FUNG|nr:hypothetical protein BGW38_000905 [Lunasporangiospora selenospora]